MNIRTVLIANRGEIACRVIRSARKLGLRSVAVYASVDAQALHVKLADVAVPLFSVSGNAWATMSSSESAGSAHESAVPAPAGYLDGDAVIAAALAGGADAIHPGYGFLSENAAFVQACAAAGLTFIGPSADAIGAMGLKDAAKRLMEEAGVPVVPGYHGEDQQDARLASEAARIGYPVLIKARAGGGGKGMRRVDTADSFASMLHAARREARGSFGDEAVLIEKYIEMPRHIEVQVFGDTHGNLVHLFERDCSLQRRHQKVIEEAPAPGMTTAVRRAMTDAALAAARSIDYVGAGTVEFIVDGANGLREDGFWFMEMNTRLQVEHPVTEAVTGVDLVEWQFRIAAGEKLPLTQDQIKLDGHAVEARLYAEDVSTGFLPATGVLEVLKFSPNARVDSGVVQGDTVSTDYDPLLAKLITHEEDRDSALRSLVVALEQTIILGTVTNRAFLSQLARHSDVRVGVLDTGLIERQMPRWQATPELRLHSATPGAAAPATLPAQELAEMVAAILLAGGDAIKPGWQLWGPATRSIQLEGSEGPMVLRVEGHPRRGPGGMGWWAVERLGRRHRLRLDAVRGGRLAGSAQLSLRSAEGGLSASVAWVVRAEPPAGNHGGALVAGLDARTVFHVQIEGVDCGVIQPAPGRPESNQATGDAVVAPMPGRVIATDCAPGDSVQAGDALLIVEAMKMEHRLLAPRDGVVEHLSVKTGDSVAHGMVLATLVPLAR